MNQEPVILCQKLLNNTRQNKKNDLECIQKGWIIMLKAKEDLEVYLKREMLKLLSNTAKCNAIYDYIIERYNIPKSITSDYITLRTPLMEASEFVLYCLLDGIESITKPNKSAIPNYFVENEIKTYSVSQFKVAKIKFPLCFKAIQVADDQWLTTIDFKLLMGFRAMQLINYNENTQRVMKTIVNGDDEVYVPTVDKTAVAAIEESYRNDTYIPTPLTFNIPEDTDANFYYDEETCELVIKSLDHFDIVDGYHRYLGACKACDADKNINRNMELRIVNFPEYKAKHFIYQEDQKTKMSKVVSDTFNQTNIANNIVDRINESPQSNLQGMITRNKTLINFADFADLINYFFLSKVKPNNSTKITVSNKLIECFNALTEYDTTYLEKKYSYGQLFIVMYVFNRYADDDKTEMCRIIKEAIEKINLSNFKRASKKVMINEIEKILKEVE